MCLFNSASLERGSTTEDSNSPPPLNFGSTAHRLLVRILGLGLYAEEQWLRNL
jgi:hypothetical protein